jgi:trehalose/maltose hydrolase-like predicted phosphorylase
LIRHKEKKPECRTIPKLLGEHLFKIIVFDWVGTAAKTALDDASAVRNIIEDLLKQNVLMGIVTDLEFSLIDQKVCWPIVGLHKQNLFVFANKGLEVFGFDDRSQPVLFHREEISEKQSKVLANVAEAFKRDVEENSAMKVEIIQDQASRLKIDLMPEYDEITGDDVHLAREDVEQKLAAAGVRGGLKEAIDRVADSADKLELIGAHITTDLKHIEISLTDESNSMRWVTNNLAKKRNIPFEDILVVGSEFGSKAGFGGKNASLLLSEDLGVRYASAGAEADGMSKRVTDLGGGPGCFIKLLKTQLKLNERLALSNEPVFLISEHGFNALREREIESILTIGNGYMGIRGSIEEERYGSDPTTMLAGVYYRAKNDSNEQIAVIPNWLLTNIYIDRSRLFLERGEIISHKRVLDLRKGLLLREWRQRDEAGRETYVRFLRFASQHDPHAVVMRITVVPENYAGEIRVKTGVKITDKSRKAIETMHMKAHEGFRGLSMVTNIKGTGIKIAQAQRSVASRGFVQPEYRTESERTTMLEEWTWTAEMGQKVDIDKFVSIYTNRDVDDPKKCVSEHVLKMANDGFEKLLAQHIDSWDRRWSVASIDVAPDPQAKKWMNFADYHLLIAGNEKDERASISARALTGPVYQGHIFWDSELFILPFFCFVHPSVARAMLMYRYHTLPAARRRAKGMGYKGAMYAWESALTGDEMTPTAVLAPNGKIIPIGSGRLEHHISSAIAHGVWLYWTVTRDTDFLLEAGAEIILETARFWASRARKGEGAYHIDKIEGPDEYHENVNDNFYTNIMAIWNIEAAMELNNYLSDSFPERCEQLRKEIALNDTEMKRWAHIASSLYKDMQNKEGLIEQFAGYFQLEDIDVEDFEPRTAPLDLILGRQRTESSQVVKQADVVMALYLLENRFNEDIVRNNFEYYNRRTSHGSSLSPSIYGLVAARLGYDKLACHYFRKTAMIDLADNMGNAAGGVHIAALGGLWQQLIMGFAGIRVRDEGLFIFPNLPRRYEQLSFSLMWRSLRLHFDLKRADAIKLRVKGKRQLEIGIFGKSLQKLKPEKSYISTWKDGTWSEFKEKKEM